MVDHGIHVPGGDEKGQARFPVDLDTLGIPPVWLGQDRHRVAPAFQHPPDDSRAKGGVIHIGVPDDIDKIRLSDPSFL